MQIALSVSPSFTPILSHSLTHMHSFILSLSLPFSVFSDVLFDIPQ